MIAGPSGVGKGSIVAHLLERDPDRLALSVSATTRGPRSSEVEGVHYRFVSDDAFDAMIRRAELLEWAEVVGHRSGTPRREVDAMLASGRDVVLEIDVQGARQIRDLVPDAVLIFVAPPSLEELERRLRARGTESEERIALRLATASEELDERERFDHVVVNDDLTTASSQVAAIIDASRAGAHTPPSEDTAR